MIKVKLNVVERTVKTGFLGLKKSKINEFVDGEIHNGSATPQTFGGTATALEHNVNVNLDRLNSQIAVGTTQLAASDKVVKEVEDKNRGLSKRLRLSELKEVDHCTNGARNQDHNDAIILNNMVLSLFKTGILHSKSYSNLHHTKRTDTTLFNLVVKRLKRENSKFFKNELVIDEKNLTITHKSLIPASPVDA